MPPVLGIDYGQKRVGVAFSDADGRMAFPSQVYANNEALLEELGALVARKGVQHIVVGHSRDFQGNENPIAVRARAFGEAISRKTGVSVSFLDETLTSREARRQFEEKEKTRSSGRRAIIDASAAALILQSYLDRR